MLVLYVMLVMSFRSDREIVLEAVKSDMNALCYVSDEFRSDREIVLAVVKSDGCALHELRICS